MSALELQSVTYRFPDAEAPALRDVSISVAPGEFVVLAGLTGSGKSTLLRAACGLVPHFHGGEFAGRVRVGGMDTREHGPGEIARVAGTLFQDPETQVVMGTVRAELALPLENRGHGDAAVARGVEEAALALGIEGLLERSTHELSGGELQRVALGAALAGRPQVVLLDEPTSQLDPVAGDELISLLRRLNEEWGTAVVLAEHRLERCLAAADRLVALVGGAVACDASPQEFLRWAADASPALQTPAARLLAAVGVEPPPAGVKEARATLRAHGLLPLPEANGAAAAESAARPRRGVLPFTTKYRTETPRPPATAPAGGVLPFTAKYRPETPRPPTNAPTGTPSKAQSKPALRFHNVWNELKEGRAILRGVSADLAPGERVALMGRNGAGKSTLLRHAAGLDAPTRGRIESQGRVALLLQSPGDYFVRDRVGDEADPDVLAAAGLAQLADRDPRDLSGGERQRLALAIVTAPAPGEPAAAALCLDEPTRGMDRAHKAALADLVRALADDGMAILVATHDVEFAAACAQRVILLGDGRPVADGPIADVLTGGWYFATETARILGGAGGALDAEAGAALLRGVVAAEVAP